MILLIKSFVIHGINKKNCYLFIFWDGQIIGSQLHAFYTIQHMSITTKLSLEFYYYIYKNKNKNKNKISFFITQIIGKMWNSNHILNQYFLTCFFNSNFFFSGNVELIFWNMFLRISHK